MPPTEVGEAADGDPEIRLWHQAADGDPAARTRLAQVISEAARAGCARLGCNAAEAEELESRLQASIWQLMLVARTTPRTNLRAFLHHRLFDVSNRYFHEMKRVRDLLPLLDDDALVDPAPKKISAAEQGEAEQALHACIAKLPSDQRLAIERRYLHGDSIEQCKKYVASSNANTIRVWIHRGILALHSCMRKKGHAP